MSHFRGQATEGIYAIGDNEVDGVDSVQAANIVTLNRQLAAIGAKIAPLYDDFMAKFQNLRVLVEEQQNDVQGSLDTFFSTFGGVADTKTDADGKFTLSVPEGKSYVLVAQTSRSVGDTTEKYYWIEDVDLTKANNGLTILLSNDNLVDDPVSELKVDSSLVVPVLADLPVEMYGDDYVKAPAAYTFKSPTGEIVTPDSTVAADPSSSTNSDAVTTPTVPAWTPPNPIPAQDNWTWNTKDNTYQNVVITGFNTDDDTVSIVHSTGVAHVPVALLPPDIRKTQLLT